MHITGKTGDKQQQKSVNFAKVVLRLALGLENNENIAWACGELNVMPTDSHLFNIPVSHSTPARSPIPVIALLGLQNGHEYDVEHRNRYVDKLLLAILDRRLATERTNTPLNGAYSKSDWQQ